MSVPSTYHINGGGKRWEFNKGSIDLSAFSSYGTQDIHEDGMTLVATMPIEEGETFAPGRGDGTYTGDVADAYFWLDARMVTDDDADGEGDQFEGSYKLAVVNAAFETVTGGQIKRGELNAARRGDPANDKYGDWGVPFARQPLMNGRSEIPAGEGYHIGLFIETDSGNKEFNLADSSSKKEGYIGHPMD